jgi:tetratricopeptide (TPR) repeat protein
MSHAFPKPDWEHASSQYQCVTPGLIDHLQTEFFAGRKDFGGLVPGLSREYAAAIVAETLEADRIWNLPPSQMLSDYRLGPENDFKRAVLSGLMFEIAKAARHDENQEGERTWWAAAMSALEEALRSPYASPMLWYEDIFWEMVFALGRDETDKKLGWLKRGLAFNLRFHDGNNAANFLRDLADTYLDGGHLDQGLRMFASLLRHNPADIWTYNNIALTFDRHGLTEIGAQATRRGLALLDAKGEPEKIRKQLETSLDEMQKSEMRGREKEVTPSILQDLRAALSLDFAVATERPLEALSRELVPDLDKIPVKRPVQLSDISLPDRETTWKRLTELSIQSTKEIKQFTGKSKSKRKRHK